MPKLFSRIVAVLLVASITVEAAPSSEYRARSLKSSAIQYSLLSAHSSVLNFGSQALAPGELTFAPGGFDPRNSARLFMVAGMGVLMLRLVAQGYLGLAFKWGIVTAVVAVFQEMVPPWQEVGVDLSSLRGRYQSIIRHIHVPWTFSEDADATVPTPAPRPSPEIDGPQILKSFQDINAYFSELMHLWPEGSGIRFESNEGFVFINQEGFCGFQFYFDSNGAVCFVAPLYQVKHQLEQRSPLWDSDAALYGLQIEWSSYRIRLRMLASKAQIQNVFYPRFMLDQDYGILNWRLDSPQFAKQKSWHGDRTWATVEGYPTTALPKGTSVRYIWEVGDKNADITADPNAGLHIRFRHIVNSPWIQTPKVHAGIVQGQDPNAPWQSEGDHYMVQKWPGEWEAVLRPPNNVFVVMHGRESHHANVFVRWLRPSRIENIPFMVDRPAEGNWMRQFMAQTWSTFSETELKRESYHDPAGGDGITWVTSDNERFRIEALPNGAWAIQSGDYCVGWSGAYAFIAGPDWRYQIEAPRGFLVSAYLGKKYEEGAEVLLTLRRAILAQMAKDVRWPHRLRSLQDNAFPLVIAISDFMPEFIDALPESSWEPANPMENSDYDPLGSDKKVRRQFIGQSRTQLDADETSGNIVLHDGSELKLAIRWSSTHLDFYEGGVDVRLRFTGVERQPGETHLNSDKFSGRPRLKARWFEELSALAVIFEEGVYHDLRKWKFIPLQIVAGRITCYLFSELQDPGGGGDGAAKLLLKQMTHEQAMSAGVSVPRPGPEDTSRSS